MTDLLTLIRTVDPKDEKAMLELNARFRLFLNHPRNKYRGYNMKPYSIEVILNNKGDEISTIYSLYTKSLDTLLAVQEAELEGWAVTIYYGLNNYSVHLQGCSSDFEAAACSLTMAWMYALVQAIQWKRENDD